MTFNPKDGSRTATFSEARAELRSHARFIAKRPVRSRQTSNTDRQDTLTASIPVSLDGG